MYFDQFSNAKEYQLGVLLVHGIGAQRLGDTIVEWGDALIKTIKLATSDDLTIDVEKAKISQENSTAESVVHFKSKSGDEKWLLSEAWWAEAFVAPTYLELASWSLRALPWTISLHLLSDLTSPGQTRSRKFFKLIGRLLLWSGFVPLILSVIGLILLIGVLPIPQLRSSMMLIQGTLIATVGDCLAFIESPMRAGLIRNRVSERLDHLKNICDKTIIIAHSQGAAVVLESLGGILALKEVDGKSFHVNRRNESPQPDRIVTFGAGINKLASLKAINNLGKKNQSTANFIFIFLLLIQCLLAFLVFAIFRADISFFMIGFCLLLLTALFLLSLIRRLFSKNIEDAQKTVINPMDNYLHSADNPTERRRENEVSVSTPSLNQIKKSMQAEENEKLALPKTDPIVSDDQDRSEVSSSVNPDRSQGRSIQALDKADFVNRPQVDTIRDPSIPIDSVTSRDRSQVDQIQPKLRAQDRWYDFFADSDPVPNGETKTLGEHSNRTRKIWNRGSVFGDHTSYWENLDCFVFPVARICADTANSFWTNQIRIENELNLELSQWRVLWLKTSRWGLNVSIALAASLLWFNHRKSFPSVPLPNSWDWLEGSIILRVLQFGMQFLLFSLICGLIYFIIRYVHYCIWANWVKNAQEEYLRSTKQKARRISRFCLTLIISTIVSCVLLLVVHDLVLFVVEPDNVKKTWIIDHMSLERHYIVFPLMLLFLPIIAMAVGGYLSPCPKLETMSSKTKQPLAKS